MLRENARGFATGSSGTRLASRDSEGERKLSGSGAEKMSNDDCGGRMDSSFSSTSYGSGASKPAAACEDRSFAVSSGLSSG